MKKTKIIYWVFTGLFAAFMLFSSIPDILCTPDAITFMKGHLGYPVYILPFLGVAKALGIIAILIPGFPRIKEWAYAGLMFDLVGAMYSLIAVKEGMGWLFMLLPISFLVVSYVYWRRGLRESANKN